METVLGLLCGIALSAACGFRVFVPLFGVGIAAASGHLTLASGFEWMGSPIALVAFGTATVLEIAAYYVPWLDHLLDTIATPAAVVAGTILTAAMVGDMSPFLRWTLALIAGGGAAALVQSGTVAVRGASLATTGGLANPLVATGELAGAAATTTLAMVSPVLAVILLAALATVVIRRFLPRTRALPPPVPL
jgi:hypothetical protein